MHELKTLTERWYIAGAAAIIWVALAVRQAIAPTLPQLFAALSVVCCGTLAVSATLTARQDWRDRRRRIEFRDRGPEIERIP